VSGADGSEQALDGGVFLRLAEDAVAAYDAGDIDAYGVLFAQDLVGVDHRPASLGRYGREDIIRYTEGLFAQARTQRLVVSGVESRGNVVFLRTQESVETLAGVELLIETLMVEVIVGGRVQRQEVFAPDAHSDARAVFEKLAALV
jgi:hypothetical protein